MRGLRALSVGLVLLALGTGQAAASAAVDEALGRVTFLLMLALLLWVIGSFFAAHRYDSGGPKGGPLSKP